MDRTCPNGRWNISERIRAIHRSRKVCGNAQHRVSGGVLHTRLTPWQCSDTTYVIWVGGHFAERWNAWHRDRRSSAGSQRGSSHRKPSGGLSRSSDRPGTTNFHLPASVGAPRWAARRHGMSGIERDNPSLKGVLPKDYARPALDMQRLGQLIDLVTNIKAGDADSRFIRQLWTVRGVALKARVTRPGAGIVGRTSTGVLSQVQRAPRYR